MRFFLYLSSLLIFLLQGCVASGYQTFYEQKAPFKYPKTEKVIVFEYENVDIRSVYDFLFSDYLIVGEAGFEGPYDDPSEAVGYAKTIGADILITTVQFKESRTSIVPMSFPTTNTTYMSGYSGSNMFSGTATSYGMTTSSIPVTVDRYTQEGLFLKNVNGVKPIWEHTKNYYSETEKEKMTGKWKNEIYELEVYKSGVNICAFIVKAVDRDMWSDGQLKFIYNTKDGNGLYLMGDKTPIPAMFALNKFGHLEVSLAGAKDKFSFARIE